MNCEKSCKMVVLRENVKMMVALFSTHTRYNAIVTMSEQDQSRSLASLEAAPPSIYHPALFFFSFLRLPVIKAPMTIRHF